MLLGDPVEGHLSSLQMVLRLLAFNAEQWLADRLNTYLADNDEYRTTLRHLLHLGGHITYTPKILMPLARRSRVAETGGASPADVVSPWRRSSPHQRLTLEPAPVGYSGLPPSQSASLRLLIFMRAPRSTRLLGRPKGAGCGDRV